MTVSQSQSSARPIGKRPANIESSERPNTLGIAQRELDLLLDELDNLDSPVISSKREFARWPFRQTSIQVEFNHPGGTVTKLRLACRNLSRGGIGLLHNVFVHPGSPARVWLPRLLGGVQEMAGVMTRCSHRRGLLHEISIKFSKPLDLRMFIDASRNKEFCTLENVVPEKLAGRILYIEDCPIYTRIIQHFLRDTQVRMRSCDNGAAGLLEASQGFDLILCDWRLPDMTGTEVLAKIRARGIQTPALIVTSDPANLMKSGFRDRPDVGVLAKPITQQRLLRMLAERLIVDRDSESGTKIAVDGELREQLGTDMFTLIDKLDAAIRSNSVAACYEIAMRMKSVAPLIGLSETVRVCSEVTDGYSSAGGQVPASRFAQICTVARRSA